MPPLPKGKLRLLPPGPESPAPADHEAHPTAALSVFKNAQVPTGNLLPPGGDPSAAHHGHTVLFTGNWYAALSPDDGKTWSYLSPFQFPPLDRGFCCDQYTMHIPSKGITAWILQYGYSFKTKNGSYRIAIAKNESDLKKGVFHSYVFNPRHFGLSAGYAFDFPHVAYSNGNLFVTTNIFALGSTYHSTVCWRMPLSQLASGAPIRYRYVRLVGRTWRFTFGATTTMYWWQHKTNSSGYLFRWADSSTTYQRYSVKVGSWNWATWGSMVAKGPKGRNWLATSDSRPLGGWVGRGIIGFMWTAKQGGTFPFPYTRVLELRESTRSVLRESNIWNSQFAWAFPAAAENSRGHVGGVIAFGGGALYPGTAAWVVDDLDTTFAPLRSVPIAVGNDGPISGKWADYFTTSPHSRLKNTWVGTAMSQRSGPKGSKIVPRFVHFGRSRDVGPQPDLAVTAVSTPTGKLLAGGIAQVSLTIKNMGTSTATTSVTGILLSSHFTISKLDTYLGGITEASLAKGASRSHTLSVRIPYTTPNATLYLGAYADVGDSVSELDEGNNGRSTPARAAVAYTGNQRILEYRAFNYSKLAKKAGAYSRTKAVLDTKKGGSTPIALIAPQFRGYGYLLLLSQSSSFKVDLFTGLGLGILNTPIFPLWFSRLPSGGIAYPSFNLPKTTIPSSFTMYVHSFWFDPSFVNMLGLGNNSLSLRIER